MKKFKDWVVFPGYKHKGGFVTFQNITMDMLRAVFFPKDFYEKYRYLGSVPYEGGQLFNYLEPLVIFMDHKAKPWWCPRFFLRFLHLFGSDNSIVRVRNRCFHNLLGRLTKGIFMWDWKTKWHDYDLRISISGDEQMLYLCDMIEEYVYRKGAKKEMLHKISISDLKDELPTYASYCEIVELYNKLDGEEV